MKDLQIQNLINSEKSRQQNTINLIASENYVSDDVLVALGSILTNKYAEGYPGARYYGGNEYIDEIENLCIHRALQVFKLSPDDWSVNTQALSGSPANLAVYQALIPHGGKIMGMKLDHGGHLTHGFSASVTGKIWKQILYGVDIETGLINYEQLMSIAMENKPDIIVAGFTAYPRKIDWKKFREIADATGALLHVDMSHIAGLVAGGVYESPFSYADTVMTTTHKTLRGPRGALIFSRNDDRNLPSKINKAVFPGLQGGPHMNQTAGIAVALYEAMSPEFHTYAKQVVDNARVLSDALHEKGLHIISGDTDTHMVLVDTWMDGSGIPGKLAEQLLEQEGIIVNKNTIPGDTRTPQDPSGIRLGTAAETSRGKTEHDMRELANRIYQILQGKKTN